MTDENRKRLIRNRVLLARDLTIEGTSLLDFLVQEGVLSENMMEEVASGKTRYEQVKKLLDIIPRRSNDAFSIFCSALRETEQDHLAEALES